MTTKADLILADTGNGPPLGAPPSLPLADAAGDPFAAWGTPAPLFTESAAVQYIMPDGSAAAALVTRVVRLRGADHVETSADGDTKRTATWMLPDNGQCDLIIFKAEDGDDVGFQRNGLPYDRARNVLRSEDREPGTWCWPANP